MSKSTRAPKPPPQDEPTQEAEGGQLGIIAPEASRWANAGTAANAFEARATQGAKEHTGMEGQNTASPARTFESRISQAI